MSTITANQLLLFYYNELDLIEYQKISKAIDSSKELNLKWKQLQQNLETVVSFELNATYDLNKRIMARLQKEKSLVRKII
jgi:hypothetical protein